MIAINNYSKQFEEDYYEFIKKNVDNNLKQQIIDSSQKYLPNNFFRTGGYETKFKELILADYKTLNNAYNHIKTSSSANANMKKECFNLEKLNDCYTNYHNAYNKIVTNKMNIKIVLESGLLTCPYCNRDYINCRGNNVSGAQLDHFFSRKKFPIFSLSLYNLIPVCAVCNKIKSDKEKDFVSPFDMSCDFEKELVFSYTLKKEKGIEVTIIAENKLKTNVEELKLKEAYEIHNIDIEEILQKKEAYSLSQMEEIIRNLNGEITEDEIKKMIFGEKIHYKECGKRPLSKLKYDILKKLEIY